MHINSLSIPSHAFECIWIWFLKDWRTKASVLPSLPWRRPLPHHVDMGKGLLHFRCLFQAEKHQRQDAPQQHNSSVQWYLMIHNLQAEDLQKSQSNLEQLMEEAALQSQPLVYRNRWKANTGWPGNFVDACWRKMYQLVPCSWGLEAPRLLLCSSA